MHNQISLLGTKRCVVAGLYEAGTEDSAGATDPSYGRYREQSSTINCVLTGMETSSAAGRRPTIPSGIWASLRERKSGLSRLLSDIAARTKSRLLARFLTRITSPMRIW